MEYTLDEGIAPKSFIQSNIFVVDSQIVEGKNLRCIDP